MAPVASAVAKAASRQVESSIVHVPGCAGGFVSVPTLLLSSNGESTQKPRSQRSPLFKAAADMLGAFSDEDGEDISYQEFASVAQTAQEVPMTGAQLALHEQERRERVNSFLEQHGFSDVNSKQGWWNFTYPLHVAAELGDVQLVQFLLESGATRRQRDSSLRTARQLAVAVNKRGSHDAVIKVLKLSQRRLKRDAPQPVVASSATSIAVASHVAPPMEVELMPATMAQKAPCALASSKPCASVFGKQSMGCENGCDMAATGGA